MEKIKFSRVVLTLISPFLIIHASLCSAEERTQPLTCSYEMLIWNSREMRSGPAIMVRHDYRSLAEEEIDHDTGCTVCSEDQVRIDIPGMPPFSACYKKAEALRHAFTELAARGTSLTTIVGYHVIKSRGPLDRDGNRTRFSNHSFGTAIDINADRNGLYDNCFQFGPSCRLLRGGAWVPGTPGTLQKDGPVVLTLKREGLKWGGEIEGKQKDFMHFSPTGY